MIAFTNDKLLREVWLMKFDTSVDSPYTSLYYFTPLDNGYRVNEIIRFVTTQVIENLS